MLKVGLIGNGLIAREHLKNLKLLQRRVSVAGCFNPHFSEYNQRRLEMTKKKFGNLYSNFGNWLNEENPDCVVICVPPFARLKYEKKLIERKIPYLVEKPPVLSKHDDLIKTLSSRTGMIAEIGYQWRHFNFNKELVKLIEKDEIGYVHAIRFSGVPFQNWKMSNASSGGITYEKTMHIIDYCEFLFEEKITPHFFISKNSKINQNIDSECKLFDTEIFVFECENILGSISSVSYSQNNDILEISIIGRRNIYIIRTQIDGKTTLKVIKEGKIIRSFCDKAEKLYLREIKEFLRNIESNNFEITNNYIESIKTSKSVLKTIRNNNEKLHFPETS